MRKMVKDGEADFLVAERVWQEFALGLMEARPSRMFEVLRECGALAHLLPEVDALFGVPFVLDGGDEADAGVHPGGKSTGRGAENLSARGETSVATRNQHDVDVDALNLDTGDASRVRVEAHSAELETEA